MKAPINSMRRLISAALLATILVCGSAQQASATIVQVPVPTVTILVETHKDILPEFVTKTEVFLLRVTPDGVQQIPFAASPLLGGGSAVFQATLQDLGIEVDDSTGLLANFNLTMGVTLCQTVHYDFLDATGTICHSAIAQPWGMPLTLPSDLPEPLGLFVSQRDNAGPLSFPDFGLAANNNLSFILIDAATWLASGTPVPQSGQTFEFINGVSPQLPGIQAGLSPFILDPDAPVSNPRPFTGAASIIGAFDVRAIPEPSPLLLLLVGTVMMLWVRNSRHRSVVTN